MQININLSLIFYLEKTICELIYSSFWYYLSSLVELFIIFYHLFKFLFQIVVLLFFKVSSISEKY